MAIVLQEKKFAQKFIAQREELEDNMKTIKDLQKQSGFPAVGECAFCCLFVGTTWFNCLPLCFH